MQIIRLERSSAAGRGSLRTASATAGSAVFEFEGIATGSLTFAKGIEFIGERSHEVSAERVGLNVVDIVGGDVAAYI